MAPDSPKALAAEGPSPGGCRSHGAYHPSAGASLAPRISGLLQAALVESVYPFRSDAKSTLERVTAWRNRKHDDCYSRAEGVRRRRDPAIPSCDVPGSRIDDLGRRLEMTNWPEKETVTDDPKACRWRYPATRAPLDDGLRLARVEARLNGLPQFITEIDGLDIHFIHVRSGHEGALPLIVNHGWPGSIIEQLKIIDRLTDPTAHGGSAGDAFDVVIPSMPGYGFSREADERGWGPERIGRAWDALMERLGYTRYVAQGGDWGAFVVDQMGLQAPTGLLAIHTNMPATVPTAINDALGRGVRRRTSLVGREACLRPAGPHLQTGGVREDDGGSPADAVRHRGFTVGLAAWLLDHNDADGQPAAAVVAALDRTTSAAGELTRDEILDNITLYWLTDTGVSASRLYWEYKGGFFNAKGVAIPVAITVFPGEQYQAPRSWAERAYPNLIYFNEVDKGGHFAAWEQPQLFSQEVRAAFRPVR